MASKDIYATPGSIEELFNILDEELVRGWANFIIYIKLHQAFDVGRFTKVDWFLPVILESVRRETIMSLSRIAIDNRDSVTVWTLLKEANSKAEEFSLASSPQLVRDATELDAKFLKNHETAEKVKEIRDRTLAHTDMKQWRNPTKMTPPDVPEEEVKRHYDDLLQIVNRYSVWYSGEGIRYEPMTATQIQEFDEILGPYFAARQREAAILRRV